MMLRDVLAVAVLAGVAGAVCAQSYPARVVRVIVAYPPGGSMDALGRMIFDRMSQSLGQQFVIDYRPGASGSIGTEAVVRADALVEAFLTRVAGFDV